ncbi:MULTISPECIES: rRNA maturation RNase YbeY [Mesonia]|uniref:Endoribonuclease YbeY n=1 Tax=Mesonia algae TaxID=213248 RepID=A0A2W7IXG3_9FLAO|nr:MULTISPECIES: rRNA maturation RNase YbeY [Mesonia]PZW44187.1 rRNA maturation RNase YbeY [Mesonia algae]TXK78537.1 rRNA maturation RNase YbeY [Mesonia sp. K4-1]
MIQFFSENDFTLENKSTYEEWISSIINSEGHSEGEINYIFCDDDYLLNLNNDFLNHDTLTDIITFNYNMGKQVNSDIYISTERVRDNAQDFDVSFETELRRVMCHGVLHLCGFNDKTDEEQALMTEKENEKMKMFHVEQ